MLTLATMKAFCLILLLVCGVVASHGIRGPGHVVDCKGGHHKGFGKHPKIFYYYDEEIENCIEFVYFGSGGNNNRHETREKCQEACKVDY